MSDREIVARRMLAKLENDRLSNQIDRRPYYPSKQQRKETLKTDKSL